VRFAPAALADARKNGRRASLQVFGGGDTSTCLSLVAAPESDAGLHADQGQGECFLAAAQAGALLAWRLPFASAMSRNGPASDSRLLPVACWKSGSFVSLAWPMGLP